MTKIKTILSIFVFLSAVLSAHANTQKLKDNKKQLNTLNNKMVVLEKSLRQDKKSKDKLLSKLKTIEIQISKNRRALDKKINKVKSHQDKLNTLNQQQLKTSQNLNFQLKLFSKQLLMHYQLGHHEPLKLLLNQDSPQRLGRMLTYYQYANKRRADVIKSISNSLASLKTLKKKSLSQNKNLDKSLKSLRSENKTLGNISAKRELLLKQLSSRIESKDDSLKELARNKAQLERVLQKLVKTTKARKSSKPFYKMRGKLLLPARGIIIKRFGRDDKLKSNGIIIAAQKDASVHAIYEGKVIFADWLRGFGLLLIVEHNKSYMSLYAHNSSLYKKVGETVNTHEKIARVGSSGNTEKNSLYFEIRHKGKPIDPLKWCV